MKNIVFLCFFMFINITLSQTTKRDIQQEYKKNLSLVYKSMHLKKGETMGDELDIACKYLEKVSSIKANMVNSFDPTYFPTDQNLKDWKDWYRKNKKRLYWDEKEQKVKVRELIKPHR